MNLVDVTLKWRRRGEVHLKFFFAAESSAAAGKSVNQYIYPSAQTDLMVWVWFYFTFLQPGSAQVHVHPKKVSQRADFCP